jgi:hypothetical protein
MSNEQNKQTPPSANPSTEATVEMLAQAFAKAMGISNSQLADAIKGLQPKEKITIRNRSVHNPMNPGNKPRKFPQKIYQNFTEVYEDDVTDREYELLLQLQPGGYITGKSGEPLLEVIEVKRGAQRGLHFRYSNKTRDQQMEFMVKAGASMEDYLFRAIKEYERNKVEAKAQRRKEREED